MAKKRLVENLQRKGVKKMKKLLAVVVASTMAMSFLPIAKAADTAALNLKVSFELPMRIYAVPEGPFEVREGKELKFNVVGEDPLGRSPIVIVTVPRDVIVTSVERTPTRIEDAISWTPAFGSARKEPYILRFRIIADTNGDKGFDDNDVHADLNVKVTVLEAVIAIEMNKAEWKLEGVKLNDKILNKDELTGKPLHNITNTGDVVVNVEIGYAGYEGCKPGVKPGLDQFMTTHGYYGDFAPPIIQPDGYLMIAKDLGPGESSDMPLTYYSPTALSENIKGMTASYELRAYAK